jgi:hypothetical protein
MPLTSACGKKFSRSGDSIRPVARGGWLPERESDYFYTSEFDAKLLIDEALKELAGNQLVIFVVPPLGSGRGLVFG